MEHFQYKRLNRVVTWTFKFKRVYLLFIYLEENIEEFYKDESQISDTISFSSHSIKKHRY